MSRWLLGRISQDGDTAVGCQDLASLLAQSKHCTCLFISSSSLSLLTVGKYTQTLQINYKLSGPVPLLIIMCKSQKKKKKSWFVELKHLSISAMNINVLWHKASCALSSPNSVVVLVFSSRLLIEASLCIPVVTSVTLLMFERERRRSCLRITRCSAGDSWLIRWVHQSREETKRASMYKEPRRLLSACFCPLGCCCHRPVVPQAYGWQQSIRWKSLLRKSCQHAL